MPQHTAAKRLISWTKYFLLFLIGIHHINYSFANHAIGPRRNLFKVSKVRVEGTRKVEPEAILEKIKIKPGINVDNYLLNEDLKAIYALKHFDEVEFHREGNELVIKVKEKPLIGNIIFEGNDELTDDELQEKMKTKEYSILDVNSIKADITAIQKLYEEKGFYLATVSYKLRKTDNDVMEVIFHVKEFEKVRVKKITFLGTNAFSDEQLKSLMETREENFLSFLNNAGNFKEFNFQTDVERLKYFYKSKGYLQVNIGTPTVTVSEDRKWVFISMKITEGPKFTVNEIFFNGELLFSEEEMVKNLGLKENDTYSEDQLRKDIQKLTEMYQDQGYAFANVLRTLEIVPGENRVNINYSFEKGKIAYFGKIYVKGNSKTRDKVVRRELRIHEGMKYSGTKLKESKENVNRLGFFKPGTVVFNTTTPKGKDDILDVEISVEERNTGQITLGAGYSTASKGFLQASISQNNFMGKGQVLSFSLSLSSVNQTYNVGFTEPYFMDTLWSAGGEAFRTRNDARSSFSYLRQGFNLRVGYPIFEYTRLFLTYKFEDTTIKTANDPTINLVDENGIASSVRTSVINDRRNNRFEPSGGYYGMAALEYTGVAGDKRWIKTELEGRYYKKLVGDLVFRSRIAMNKLIKNDTRKERNIPRSEKFVLGGSRNLRGYNFEDVGPLRTYVDPISGRSFLFNVGGLMSLVNTFELEHPLVREAGLKWVVFTDFGNVYDDFIGVNDNWSLRSDYGFGFRWFSPIGVLRFEFGFPIDRREREASNQFYFDIGQLF
jgi:outer membrane protein insertion porin family